MISAVMLMCSLFIIRCKIIIVNLFQIFQKHVAVYILQQQVFPDFPHLDALCQQKLTTEFKTRGKENYFFKVLVVSYPFS